MQGCALLTASLCLQPHAPWFASVWLQFHDDNIVSLVGVCTVGEPLLMVVE